MSRLTLGVIGHVDHGKTALVAALSGIDTDRLPEEKRRGISIALGFAHLRLGAGEIDLIDMPGHERFVRTMISGASGIDAVLLVVAANEGVRPQTVEHVQIAALLGIRRAILAVSKADCAPPDRAREVGAAAAALLADNGLAAQPPLLVSAVTGQGLDDLREAIAMARDAIAPPPDCGFAFLPIDRAFTIAGHGTVVTGTLRRGALGREDIVEVLPGGARLRIRGVQVHGRAVERAEPGQRVAVNLRRAEVAEVPRGAALVSPGALEASRWISAEVISVAGAPSLANAARLQLLFGTDEVAARLRLLDRDALEPGERALAQLHTARPIHLPGRERFILRLASPAVTVAGGRVLDPDTTRQRRHAAGVLERLAALAAAGPAEILAGEIARAGARGVPLSRLARLTGLARKRVADMLAAAPVLITRGGHVVARPAMETLLPRLLRRIGAELEEASEGLPRGRVAALLPEVDGEILGAALDELIARGRLRQDGTLLRIAQPAREQARERQNAMQAAELAEALRRGGLSPPDLAGLAPHPQARRLVAALVRAGILVRTIDRVQQREVVFHREAIAAAQRRLAPLLASGEGLLVREVGAALGISRKYSVPLLEYLDAIHFTRRVGDRRVLGRPEQG